MNDLEMLQAVNIVIEDLEKQIRPQATGHIHTTISTKLIAISTLHDYADTLKLRINIKQTEGNHELRV